MRIVEGPAAGYDSRVVKRYGHTQRVSARAVTLHNKVDLLIDTEARCLGELIRKVHTEGRVGLHWPTITRTAVDHSGKVIPLDVVPDVPESMYEWQIEASVLTVPR